MTSPAKQNIINVFDLVAAGYDNPATRFFHSCGDRLVGKLKPAPNSTLLDIASGTGAVALPAAQALLPEGKVHAIDLSEKMLDKALLKLQQVGLSNTEFQVMDGEHLEFNKDYFDYITCSFGLFFFEDMLTGLKEWYRVLKPGGRIMFTSFSPNAFQPLGDIFRQDMAKFGVDIPETDWQRLKSTEECQRLLEQAGYFDINIDVEQMGYHLKDINDWWELVTNTAFRGLVNQLEPAKRAEFQNIHQQHIQQHATDKGIWLDIETIFTSGSK